MKFTVVKGEDGKLRGVSAKDDRALAKARRTIDSLEIGECLGLAVNDVRSRRHMGFFFCKLRELFDRQERFPNQDHLLEWLKVGAGYADLLPGAGGVLVAVPRSISWDECDEQTFTEVGRAIDDFMWSDAAQETLWPHLSPEQRHENVKGWHDHAEHNRQVAIIRRIAEQGG